MEQKTKILKTITVRTEFEGIHNYPEAPEEVYYLRSPHRHIFHVEVTIEVKHDDRDIEFIMLKHKIDKYIEKYLDNNKVWNMGSKSCEQVADDIVMFLYLQYCVDPIYIRYKTIMTNNRYIKVSVFEDGENGATVERRVSDEF